MKQKIILILLFIIAGFNLVQAQQINYQGIARNANGVAIAFQDISLRLTIKDVSGNPEYSETRKLRTNQFGLFVALIGSTGATNTTGSMAAVNWIAGNKTLQVEIDPAGGSSFLQAGSTPLVYVPYAIFSNAAYPVGPAGGDLKGSTYPDPTIAPLAVTNAKITNPYINFNNLQVQLGKGQYFAIGTNGNDFNISSIDSTHTFNIPTSSSTRRGLLNSVDWTTFNNKQNAILLGTTAQYFRGDLSLSNFQTDVRNQLSAGTNITYTNGQIGITNNSVTINTLPLTLGGSQSFAAGTNGVDFNISSTGTVHTFNIPTASATQRGLINSVDYSNFTTAFNNRITSLTTTGTGAATLSSNVLNIPTYVLPAATGTTLGGIISGANITNSSGTISITGNNVINALGSQAANSFFAAPNGAAGNPSFRPIVVADIPTLNQNTTGSAATLLSARNIYGIAFNGSADVSGIIASNFGGTGNGFTRFTGPTTAEKTFTLPNANATILTDNAAVTIAQGGTGASTKTAAFDALSPMTTSGDIIYGAATGTGTRLAAGTNGQILTLAGGIPSWATNNQWSILGNTGLNAVTNFLGTTDAIALRFRVQNTWAGEINPLTTNTSFGFESGLSNIATANSNNNTSLGYRSLRLTAAGGTDNTAIGQGALQNNVTGDNNTAIGQGTLNLYTANNNTAVGHAALRSNVSADFNTAVGRAAQEFTTAAGNTAVGYFALRTNTTGSNNTAIGNGADVSLNNLSNATAIGNGAIVDANNKVRIGNATVGIIEGQVAYSIASDARFKYNIEENIPGLEFITKLKPVSYLFDDLKLDNFVKTGDLNAPKFSNVNYSDKVQIRKTGFLAQDVEYAAKSVNFDFDGIHKPQNARDHYSLAYSQFVVPLVKAVQEQQTIINSLEERIAALEKLIKEKLK
ncbi:MAG: tail fiber domain-containing protein [Sphingobacteriia bacterium]|jgi:hypothetical protein